MFAAPKLEPMPETSPKQKADPETVTSEESGFESAEESLAPKTKGWRESPDPQTKLVEEEPHLGTETNDDPLAYSSFWTKPRPPQNPYTPIKNLFASIIDLNQPQTQQIPPNTTAQPTNGLKELNLNKPNTFDRDQEKFRKFLQNVKVYMDINHEVYNTDLKKIAFVLSFMTAGAAATWKAQFIDKVNTWPAPANPNDELGTHATFKKNLINAFSMFDLVGDALDELHVRVTVVWLTETSRGS
jgi:hypothetical protein